MGYRIVYGQPCQGKQPVPDRDGHLLTWIMAALGLFVLLTNLFWPEGKAMLRQLVIPGNPEVTTAAFQELMNDLGSGEPAGEAVSAFCREILANG